MEREPEKLTISVNERDSVTALLYLALKSERCGVTLILGHGAGSNQLSPFMQLFAKGLAARGLDVLTFNFVYMEQGRSIPDQRPKLEACYVAVIETARRHKKLKANRVAIGGKSMGGRIASQVASNAREGAAGDHVSAASAGELAGDLAGLVFLGYPLHPPGRPEKLRDAHLPGIVAPMLFIQGSRDAFGGADEIRGLIKRLKLPAELNAIEGGDHSLKVPKSSAIPQQQIYESAMDEIARWLKASG